MISLLSRPIHQGWPSNLMLLSGDGVEFSRGFQRNEKADTLALCVLTHPRWAWEASA